MADFQLIKQEIDDNVNTNGVGAITGAILNTTLKDMVDAVNAAKADFLPGGLVFGGFVHSDSSPAGTGYYYLADSAGVYTNFGNASLDGNSLVLFYYDNGTWNNAVIAPSLAWTGLVLLNDDLYLRLGFPIFDPSEYYYIGNTVVYQGNLYRFNSNHNGAWTGNDVAATDIWSEVILIADDLNDQISTKQDIITNLSTIEAGAAAGATAYQKPASGIPSSDMTNAVQTSLGKADTAYQKPASGIPSSDMSSAVQTSLGLADTAIQDVSGKMDKVPSATVSNIAQFASGGGVVDSGVNVFDLAVLAEDASTPPASMEPNTVYKYGTLAGNTTFPALATPTNNDIANVYCWTFATPATAPTITWPVAITDWAGGSAPTINASKKYEVSVMDGLATIIEA